MSNKFKSKVGSAVIVIELIILGLIVVGGIGLSIYCWIRYGNLPPDEVPSWVHWLMWRR